MPILEPGRTKPFARTPVRCLVIVARDQVDLYHALQRAFGENEKVSVLLDRRREERRRGIHPVEANLRRMDRRDLPHVDDDLRLRKYVLVRPHYAGHITDRLQSVCTYPKRCPPSRRTPG